jgi:hypothetical protein
LGGERVGRCCDSCCRRLAHRHRWCRDRRR